MTDPFDDAHTVRYSFKPDRDYDAPLINFGGRNLRDIATQVEAALDAGDFATIGKLDRLAKKEYALGAGLGASPLESGSASTSAPARGAPDEAQAELIPFEVPFTKKADFKQATGLPNAVYREKVWHAKGDEAAKAAEDAGFKRKE